MEPQKPITNPMLCGAIELMRADNTLEHRSLYIGELVKARFLVPVIADKPPVVDESGKPQFENGTQIKLPMLPGQENKRYFMAYTDGEELRKWKAKGEGIHIFIMTFQKLAAMMLNTAEGDPANVADGFIINPFGTNVIVTKELASQLTAPAPEK